MERLTFFRAPCERKLQIASYEIELEEDGRSSHLGKRVVCVRHRPHIFLGLGIDRGGVYVETTSLRAILRNNECDKSPFRRRVSVFVAHLQEFIAFLLHDVQLLRRVGALPNFYGALRAFELGSIGGTPTGGWTPTCVRNISLYSSTMSRNDFCKRLGKCVTAHLMASSVACVSFCSSWLLISMSLQSISSLTTTRGRSPVCDHRTET